MTIWYTIIIIQAFFIFTLTTVSFHSLSIFIMTTFKSIKSDIALTGSFHNFFLWLVCFYFFVWCTNHTFLFLYLSLLMWIIYCNNSIYSSSFSRAAYYYFLAWLFSECPNYFSEVYQQPPLSGKHTHRHTHIYTHIHKTHQKHTLKQLKL